MKIGELAEKYNITRDAIRYYVNHGLLSLSKGPHYNFTQKDIEDLQLILKMKRQQFSLQEISDVLTLHRIGNMIEPDIITAYKDILERKHDELQEQARQLQLAMDSISQDIQKLSDNEADRGIQLRLGVPLSALQLLRCPKCKGTFNLEEATLNSQYVSSGKLRCSCGYSMRIEDGIVQTGNLYQGQHDWPDLNRNLYSNISNQFVSAMQRCHDQVLGELLDTGLKDKVVLETHINGYFFAYNHITSIPPECLYIVTDKFPEMLYMYKKLIEKLNRPVNFLFIADNTMNLPLKPGCVDLVVDFMSDVEHCLYNPTPYISLLKPFLKSQAFILGTVIGYHGLNRSQILLHKKYPESAEPPMNLDRLPEEYREAGYKLQWQQVCLVENAKKQIGNFECQVKGELLHLMLMKAIPK